MVTHLQETWKNTEQSHRQFYYILQLFKEIN